MDKVYSLIDNEVILLCSVYEHINNMVNFSLLDIYSNDPHSEVRFKDGNNEKLFFILLVDFLSKTDRQGPIQSTTFLAGLSEICNQPQFSVDNSELELQTTVQNFRTWLTNNINTEIWMPSAEETINILISRIDAIKMSGNITKHNYLRAIGVAGQLKKIIDKGINPKSISLEDTLLAMPQFYERFPNDILNYHTSTLCEFLNNIRWAIYMYLKPEFDRSIHYFAKQYPGDIVKYEYQVPEAITSQYARNCYWNLMNYVRARPYMNKFVVTSHLKKRY